MRLLEAAENAEIPQWLPEVNEALCTDCDICVKTCPDQAMSLVNGIAQVNEDLCEGCRTCFCVCPRGAIKLTV